MNPILHIQLNTTEEQVARLAALQTLFSEVCNAIAPVVQRTRCWNRVALHHLVYREMREQFPQLGSQMVCNAIYSVSRMCRIVLQHPHSPWNIARLGERPLPLLQFQPAAPVYFDRHTLSLKNGRLSMYTLDGRMHFDIALRPADEVRFHQEKLCEIVLGGTARGYHLSFNFSPEQPQQPSVDAALAAEFPEYLLVTPMDQAADAAEPVPKVVVAAALAATA